MSGVLHAVLCRACIMLLWVHICLFLFLKGVRGQGGAGRLFAKVQVQQR